MFLFSAFLIFAAGSAMAQAGEPPATELIPGFRRRLLILDIDARVLEREQVVIWSETHRRLTIPGSPVGLRLVGSNVVVAVQFTPFIHRNGQSVLVAQGHIWVEVPNEGMRLHTTIQTIPLEFNEPIYFFPLGSSNRFENAIIEIVLTVKHNDETGVTTAEATADTGND
jgi:hypothetical protein